MRVVLASALLWLSLTPALTVGQELPEEALLLSAARQGNVELWRHALRLGAGSATRDSAGNSALILAVLSGSEPMLREVLATRPDLDTIGQGGMTALHQAVLLDQPSTFDRLLAIGASPDIGDSGGTTPLLLAVRLGREAMADALLMRGAAVDRADTLGMTPLMVAAQRGDHGRVPRLLRLSRDPNVRDSEQRSALFMAMFEQHWEVARLIAAHPRVDVATPVQGYPPRFYAEQFGDAVLTEIIDRRLGLS